jgi:hypothetical protein
MDWMLPHAAVVLPDSGPLPPMIKIRIMEGHPYLQPWCWAAELMPLRQPRRFRGRTSMLQASPIFLEFGDEVIMEIKEDICAGTLTHCDVFTFTLQSNVGRTHYEQLVFIDHDPHLI